MGEQVKASGWKETDYAVKAAEWRLLDTGNPAFRPVGYSGKGANMQATYTVGPDESTAQYWKRVGDSIKDSSHHG